MNVTTAGQRQNKCVCLSWKFIILELNQWFICLQLWQPTIDKRKLTILPCLLSCKTSGKKIFGMQFGHQQVYIHIYPDVKYISFRLFRYSVVFHNKNSALFIGYKENYKNTRF